MHFKKKDKERFLQAQQYSEKGELESSLGIIKELTSLYPTSAVLHAMLANLYWELNDTINASIEFKASLELDPKLEKASLGFFHLLMEQNRVDEAFSEMKRFMRLSDSKEYKRLLKEINDD